MNRYEVFPAWGHQPSKSIDLHFRFWNQDGELLKDMRLEHLTSAVARKMCESIQPSSKNPGVKEYKIVLDGGSILIQAASLSIVGMSFKRSDLNPTTMQPRLVIVRK